MNNLYQTNLTWLALGSAQEIRIALLILGLIIALGLIHGKARLRLALVLGLLGVVASEAIWMVLKNRLVPRGGAPFPALHVMNLTALLLPVGLTYREKRPLVTVGCGVSVLALAVLRLTGSNHTVADVGLGLLLGMAVGWVLWLIWNSRRGLHWLPEATTAMDWDRATVLLIVAITAWRLQIIANPNSLLVAEEAQYWDWSRRPDFSYYSKPPLTSLLILLFTSVFGSTEFGIRLAPVGISLVLVGLTQVFLRDLGVSPRGRFFALLALALTPLFAAGSITMTTDTPLMLFWGTAVWALWRIHSRGWANGWYLVGLALGLGMLSKYTMAFLIPSVLGWLATSPRTRHHLASWRPLVALGMAVMLFSPVLYWNWANNWVTFKHVAADAGVQKGLRLTPMEFLEFLVGQAVVVSPVMFGLLFYVLWQVIRGGRTTERDRFLLWMALPVFVVYGAKALQDKVQANWPALSYYAWILLAVAHLDVLDRTHASRPWTRRWLRSTVMVALGLAFLMTYALMTPESIGPLSRRYQPAARMGDWRLLAREADRVRAAMPRPDRTFVFAREYQTAALMAFYMKGQPRVFLAPDRTRRMNQYDLWPSYGNLHCWDGIYIRSGTPSLLSGRIAYCFEDYGQPVTVAVDPQNQRPRMFTIIPAYGLRSELFNSEHPETY